MPAHNQHSRIPLSVFFDKRIITIFVLGMSQGFPWFIASTALNVWLQESGVSRTNIGFAGALFLAYSINFLWSPLIDRFNFGAIGRKFGSRKTWIVCMQAVIVIACFAVSNFSPATHLRELILTMLVITICAATQDIAIDAFRIDLIRPDETQHLSVAASAVTAGWWTGYAALGFVPLWLSDSSSWDWPQIYPMLGIMMMGLMLAPLLCHEPPSMRRERQATIKQNYEKMLAGQPKHINWQLLILTITIPVIAIWVIIGSPLAPSTVVTNSFFVPFIVLLELAIVIYILRLLWISTGNVDLNTTLIANGNRPPTILHTLLAWLLVTLIEPLKLFFANNGWRFAVAILSFILLFKVGEAFLGRMSIVFYKEVGFTNTDIALYSKLLTWLVTFVSAMIGGVFNLRYGLVKGLLISGIAMAATNLLFSVIAHVGPEKWLYMITVIADGITQAWSLVAFVAVISLLCDRTFSASQYALMASLGNAGRTLLSSSSGVVVDWLNGNWVLFFIITALMVIPSLLILVKIGPKITKIERQAVSSSEP